MDAKQRSGDLIGEDEKDVGFSSLSTLWWRGGSGRRSGDGWTMNVVHDEDE